jgi:hypothetical protein
MWWNPRIFSGKRKWFMLPCYEIQTIQLKGESYEITRWRRKRPGRAQAAHEITICVKTRPKTTAAETDSARTGKARPEASGKTGTGSIPEAPSETPAETA